MGSPWRSAAALLARALPWERLFDRRFFDVWERRGFHIVPKHFYEPLPATDDLTSSLWDWRSRSFAFDFRSAHQKELLDEFSRFQSEYSALAREPSPFEGQSITTSGAFGPVDAEVLYSLLRHLKPSRVVEVGSGFSTWIAARALTENRTRDGKYAELVAVEPYPSSVLEAGFPGLTRLVRSRMQDVDLSVFRSLSAGDVLFIDSSHVHKLGSDVQYAFSKILPILREDVYVHFHDIFLPSEYPEEWVRGRRLFWNEQHILENFLAFNTAFEVVFSSSYMHLHHPQILSAVFPSYRPDVNWPGSFWMRRKGQDALERSPGYPRASSGSLTERESRT